MADNFSSEKPIFPNRTTPPTKMVTWDDLIEVLVDAVRNLDDAYETVKIAEAILGGDFSVELNGEHSDSAIFLYDRDPANDTETDLFPDSPDVDEG